MIICGRSKNPFLPCPSAHDAGARKIRSCPAQVCECCALGQGSPQMIMPSKTCIISINVTQNGTETLLKVRE
ncbi:hypothetical protein DPMN_033295 [Dreissena polymorpha]|uniref:Uncharacterized protein n=1 Tax=Dreissena polymorpha TaxID=45954 RepID=A0A9D4M6D0_DREPO|nr:hypothetical protein DPMN_033295 [Dreissena polymorpha]